MIKVSKDEAMAIRNKMPNVCVTITSRQTNHKKYYAPEEPAVLRFVNSLRNPRVKTTEGRNGNKRKHFE